MLIVQLRERAREMVGFDSQRSFNDYLLFLSIIDNLSLNFFTRKLVTIILLQHYTLLCAHHHIEFFIIDLSVSVDIYLIDEALNLLLLHFLSEILHDISQLLSVDETIAILQVLFVKALIL